MKESMLEYKGYHTVVRYNATDGTLRGIIEGITLSKEVILMTPRIILIMLLPLKILLI